MKPLTVLSGGQTGVDRAALVAAHLAGLATGGWMPKGFRAHDGDHPDFADRFGLRESLSRSYDARTHANVIDAEATVVIAFDFGSPGEVCTLHALRAHERPHLTIDLAMPLFGIEGALTDFLSNFRTVNVAGHSERTMPGVGARVLPSLLNAFRAWRRQIDRVARCECGHDHAIDVYNVARELCNSPACACTHCRVPGAETIQAACRAAQLSIP